MLLTLVVENDKVSDWNLSSESSVMEWWVFRQSFLYLFDFHPGKINDCEREKLNMTQKPYVNLLYYWLPLL